ncbi:MAG: hypothetical protein WD851_18610 [Pirellulales bacterium]
MPDITFSSKGGDKVIADSAKINSAIVGDAQKSANAFTSFTQKTSAANIQAATNWERTAQGIIQRNLSAEQKYQTQLAKVQEVFKQNKIDAATYEKEVQRIGEQYEKAEKKADEFGEAGKENLTGQAITQIKDYAHNFGAITTVIGSVTGALQELAAERQRFAEDSKGAILGEGGLAQLANTEAEYKALLAESRALSGRLGISRDEGANITGQIQAAGVLEKKDREFFGDVRAAGLVGDVGGLAKSAETLRASMGVGEVGSYREIVSKALAASAGAPGDVASVLEASARGGTSAMALKIRDEELLALTARTATATGSPEMGGTQAAALLAQLDKFGMTDGLSVVKDKMGQGRKTLSEAEERLARADAELLEERDNNPERLKAAHRRMLDADHGLKKKFKTTEQKTAAQKRFDRAFEDLQTAEADEAENLKAAQTKQQEARADVEAAKQGMPNEAALMRQFAPIEGKTLADKLNNIKGRVDAGAALSGPDGILGDRQEAINAYRVITGDMGAYEDVLSNIDNASKNDLVGQRIKMTNTDPNLVAARSSVKTRGQSSVTPAAIDQGTYQNAFDSILEKRKTDRQESNFLSQFHGITNDWFLQSRAFFTGPDNVVRDFERSDPDAIPQGTREALELMRRQAAAAEKMQKAVEDTNHAIRSSHGLLGVPQ